MVNIGELIEIIAGFGQEKLKKLKGISFVFDPHTIRITIDGGIIRGEYYNESRTVIIYPHLINDKEDLKRVVLHELSHHFGVKEENIKW